jgi:hypothetical protein
MDVHVEIDSRSGGCSAHAAARLAAGRPAAFQIATLAVVKA